MTLENLVGKQLCDEIVETREKSDTYEEVVILNKDLPFWIRILSDKLGPPLITREEYEIVTASEDVEKSKIDVAMASAEKYGGVAKGQSLYYGVYDSEVIIILIWPWQDNINVTLKKDVL